MFSMKPAAFRRILGVVVAVGLGASGMKAQTAAEIIAKARAYLGSSAKLDAIRSVHFVGTMETQRLTADGPEPVKSSIEIIFQKPFQQRTTRTSATQIETTGLDDLEGWQRVQDVKNQSRWRLTLLAPDLVKRLRANTWENLNFFRGLEQQDGQVEVLGPATVDGVHTVKVAFIHEPGIVFYRYFDKNTGRLVLTETGQGGKIKEEGDIMVDGLRFPRKVITTTRVRDAQGRVVDNTVVVTFTKITLNEKFPDSVFAVPPLQPPVEAPISEAATP